MAGVKGRSGRKSMRDEEKRAKVIEMAWQEIYLALSSPETPREKKIEIAEKIILRDMPTSPLVDNSVKQYVQIYRPEEYSREAVASASRPAGRSL